MDSIDLIVPHQANKTMVVVLATAAGVSPDHLYLNIDKVGNTSAASIPLAIDDAVRDGVITSRHASSRLDSAPARSPVTRFCESTPR
jgi:3-oxoacyl-[acyl-carrier-protein] synthase-3